MTDTIKLEIVSAEEQIFSQEVEMVYAPAEMGEVGISPKHTPLITKLKPGDVRAQINKDEMKTFYVSGGILEIQPNEVTILSDTALREDDLDEERALEAAEAVESTGLSALSQETLLAFTRTSNVSEKQLPLIGVPEKALYMIH